jgi:acetyl-CoA/propionyl-CoA carboxylase biotin carboxyl carrier protein
MYDPMVAKLIVWDADREQATARMLRALSEYEIEGLRTLIPFHKALLATPQWRAGETCRDLIEDREWLASTAEEVAPAPGGGPGGDEVVERDYTVEVSGKRFDVKVIGRGGGPDPAAPAPAADPAGARPAPPRRAARAAGATAVHADELHSPLQGNVWKVPVAQGDTVSEGQVVTIIEAMKMENEITAHKSGVLVELTVTEGDPIAVGALIAVIRQEG